MGNGQAVLSIRDLWVRFAGITAVQSLSVEYAKPGVFGVIGPNGAGKSTLFGVISGLVPPSEGEVFFDGQSIRGLPDYEIARMGIARSFQTPRLMGPETVLTNILLGRYRLSAATVVDQILAWRSYRIQEAEHRDAATTIARALGFSASDLNRRADSLPFGVRRLVEVGRALVGGARLVLLDEPAAGLTRHERMDLEVFLTSYVRDHSVLLILTEHDVDLVRRVCTEILVMDAGSAIASGIPAQVLQLDVVKSAYFGGVPHA